MDLKLMVFHLMLHSKLLSACGTRVIFLLVVMAAHMLFQRLLVLERRDANVARGPFSVGARCVQFTLGEMQNVLRSNRKRFAAVTARHLSASDVNLLQLFLQILGTSYVLFNGNYVFRRTTLLMMLTPTVSLG